MHHKRNKGLTLLEATIALAVFMILSVSIIAVWQHTARSTAYLLARQNAFEQARGSLDVMIMNIQMARNITLTTDTQHNLEVLVLEQRRIRPGSSNETEYWNFVFYFNINALPIHEGSFQRLRFSGLTNEFARNIGRVTVTTDRYPNPQRIYVTVATACEYPRVPVTVEGSVDIRYKNFSRG